MICPKCSSPRAQFVPYEFTDDQTGYRDKGDLLLCGECGEVASEQEVLELLAGLMITEAELELCPQGEAGQIFVMALSGYTLEEVAASVSMDRRVN